MPPITSTDLIPTIIESTPAVVAIIVVILFLKYIRSRDEKDIQMNKLHEATITSIVTTHDERIEKLLEKLL